MCYLCLCSQRYIVVHVELVDFLRLWRQLEQQYWLTTQQLAKFLAIQPVRCHVYLVIYGCCSQRFLCHCSYACTCFDDELKWCGRDSVCAHAQLSRVYLASTLDVTHMIKCTRLSPTLARRAGRAWERGYALPTQTSLVLLSRQHDMAEQMFHIYSSWWCCVFLSTWSDTLQCCGSDSVQPSKWQ